MEHGEIENDKPVVCFDCLKPKATKADWDRYKEGEGPHLCWGDCDPISPIAAYHRGFEDGLLRS